MAILKCKMCGGDIAVSADKTYGTCESCGSTMTLPKIDGDQKANLYNRANHFRRQNEFDKALAIYERMIGEDDSEAEAHWGAVLCRFGIEYVEDPVTHQRVPTCHRASLESILNDVDYQAALDYTDDNRTKKLYKEEATYISEVQREILAISQKEDPYDIFICYKETDASGNRTQDSALAQDVYYQLTQEGYKVFFSRITLEDKLGQAYEPYIFAALNSAKVMITIGTKAEYYNAVWVKNEWSRYLARMKKDKKILLIPCYRDMDAYDLPEELSMLQSQDMGKIGFVQNLIRGIKKVLAQEETPTVKVVETVKVEGSTSVGVDSLLKRIELFLEDGEWDTALSYCDKVLDMDAQCAMAYVYRLCAKLKCSTIEKLEAHNACFVDDKDCQKAIRFGDVSLKTRLESYNTTIANRIEKNRKDRIYNEAMTLVARNLYEEAIGKFESIKDYNDTAVQLADCEEKKSVSIYDEAMLQKQKGSYGLAITNFQRIANYRDAKEQIVECEAYGVEQTYQEALDMKKSTYYQEAIKKFQSIDTYKDSKDQVEDCNHLLVLENQKKKQEQADIKKQTMIATKKRKMGAIIVAIACALIAIGVAVYSLAIVPMMAYGEASELLEQSDYDAAVEIFAELGNYRDSADMILEALYVQASALLVDEEYDAATSIFSTLGEYKDSPTAVQEALYIEATELFDCEYFYEASMAFSALEGYNDSADMADESLYIAAIRLLQQDNIGGACAIFTKLGDYKDSIEQAQAACPVWISENSSIISAGDTHTVGLKDNGHVVATIYTGDYYDGQCEVQGWTDIVSVAAGGSHTVGLKSDGTVEAVGNEYYDKCDVSNWVNIVSISAGDKHTVGLQSSGAMVAVGSNYYNQCDIEDWQDIVSISAGSNHTVGLKSDGTVVAVGDNSDGQCNIGDWTEIVAISAGNYHTVGLKSDGTVVTVGDNDSSQCDTSDWADIISISAGDRHTIGLKSDGTVVAVGNNSLEQCNVEEWSNIVAISAGKSRSVGLNSDGTTTATGNNDYGQCDVSGWSDIQVPSL